MVLPYWFNLPIITPTTIYYYVIYTLKYIPLGRLQNFHAFLSQEAQITTVEELKLLEQVEIIIEGKGYFLGYLMPSKKVNVNILGKGHCKVNTIEKLHVEIKEMQMSSQNPILYKRITGKGDVYFID